jgi:hypothetical protein
LNGEGRREVHSTLSNRSIIGNNNIMSGDEVSLIDSVAEAREEENVLSSCATTILKVS